MLFEGIKTLISNNHNLIKDSLWSIFGSVIGKGSAFISGIFIARLLGKISYGEYTMLKNTFLSVSIISLFGLGYLVTKVFAENKDNSKTTLNVILNKFIRLALIISLLSCLLFFLFEEKLCVFFFENIKLKGLMRLFVITLPFSSLLLIYQGAMSGLGRFKKISLINLKIGIFQLFSSIFLCALFNAYGVVISFLLTLILNTYLLKRDFDKLNDQSKIINDTESFKLKKIFLESLPIGLQEFVHALTAWLLLFIILKNSSYSEIAFYNIGVHWGAIAVILPSMLRSVVLKYLVDGKDNLKETTSILIIFNLTITACFSLMVLVLSDYIVNFYGQEFIGVSSIIIASCLSSTIKSILSLFNQVYMSVSRNWIMLYFRLTRDIFLISLILLLFDGLLGINVAIKNIFYLELFINIFFLSLIYLDHIKIQKKINY